MNREQYDECNKYRGVIELFVSSGQYVGGADGLFDYYNLPKQERSCPSCLSRFLLERDNDIKNYESNKG